MSEIVCIIWIIGALIFEFIIFLVARYDHVVENEKYNDYGDLHMAAMFWPVVIVGLPIALIIACLCELAMQSTDKAISFFFCKEKEKEKEMVEPSYREAATCDECGR